jgi:hypothetical protein
LDQPRNVKTKQIICCENKIRSSKKHNTPFAANEKLLFYAKSAKGQTKEIKFINIFLHNFKKKFGLSGK